MKDVKKFIIGGLALMGLAATGYRAYELRKLKKEIEEEQIIEIEAEKVEEVK